MVPNNRTQEPVPPMRSRCFSRPPAPPRTLPIAYTEVERQEKKEGVGQGERGTSRRLQQRRRGRTERNTSGSKHTVVCLLCVMNCFHNQGCMSLQEPSPSTFRNILLKHAVSLLPRSLLLVVSFLLLTKTPSQMCKGPPSYSSVPLPPPAPPFLTQFPSLKEGAWPF